MKKNKKVIVFEGVDGVGKSTQARLLYFALRKLGEKTELYHFPSEGIIGKFIRNLLEDDLFDSMDSKARTLLTAADFYSQYPVSQESNIIIFDRYIYSSYASNNKINKEWIKMIHQYAPSPDIVFFMEGDPSLIKKRLGVDFGAKNISRQNDFYIRYKNLFKEIPNIKINCERSIEMIHEEIINSVIKNLSI